MAVEFIFRRSWRRTRKTKKRQGDWLAWVGGVRRYSSGRESAVVDAGVWKVGFGEGMSFIYLGKPPGGRRSAASRDNSLALSE